MSLNPECECIQMDLFRRSGMILYNIRPNLSTQTNEFTSTYWKLAEGQPAPLEGLWACATADTGGKGGGCAQESASPEGYSLDGPLRTPTPCVDNVTTVSRF